VTALWVVTFVILVAVCWAILHQEVARSARWRASASLHARHMALAWEQLYRHDPAAVDQLRVDFLRDKDRIDD
jgi:hypothetical protein